MFRVIRFETSDFEASNEINRRLADLKGKVTDIKIEKEPKYYATMVTITYEELQGGK